MHACMWWVVHSVSGCLPTAGNVKFVELELHPPPPPPVDSSCMEAEASSKQLALHQWQPGLRHRD